MSEAAGKPSTGLALYLQARLLIVFVMGFASGLPLALSSATLFFWLAEAGVALTKLGTMGGKALAVQDAGSVAVAELKEAHEGWLPGFMGT